jgi:hypothetical protein
MYCHLLDAEHGVHRWNRKSWVRAFRMPRSNIRNLIESLGLKLSASSLLAKRGSLKFDNADCGKLASEVAELSKKLPKNLKDLFDFADDPQSLDTELEELLGTYGPAIWGRGADRTSPLSPNPTNETYTKNLFYEDHEHKNT